MEIKYQHSQNQDNYIPKRKKIRDIPKFQFDETQLEITGMFIFNFNGKFTKAKQLLYDKCTMAMFALLRRPSQLPVDIMMHLFDTLVKEILLHGSEIWANSGPTFAKTLKKLKFQT